MASKNGNYLGAKSGCASHSIAPDLIIEPQYSAWRVIVVQPESVPRFVGRYDKHKLKDDIEEFAPD
jgi:hypothetical protein